MKNFFIHADLDAFFASVEQNDNPELKGKKTILKGCLIPGGGTSLMLEGIHFTIVNDK